MGRGMVNRNPTKKRNVTVWLVPLGTSCWVRKIGTWRWYVYTTDRNNEFKDSFVQARDDARVFGPCRLFVRTGWEMMVPAKEAERVVVKEAWTTSSSRNRPEPRIITPKQAAELMRDAAKKDRKVTDDRVVAPGDGSDHWREQE